MNEKISEKPSKLSPLPLGGVAGIYTENQWRYQPTNKIIPQTPLSYSLNFNPKPKKI